jgi:hypothetical protein
MRQEGVLLGFVKTVDFVYKQQGGLADAFALGGPLDHLFDLGQAARDGRDFFEGHVAARGDDAREGGFAGARWAPENE